MTSNLNLQVETLDRIAELAVNADTAAHKFAIVPIPKHPNDAYFVVESDGQFGEHELPLPARATVLSSVDQVGSFALHARDRWLAKPAIYYTPECLNVRLVDGALDRQRGAAACPLKKTKVWDKLTKWAEDPDQAWLVHKVFIRELRVTFGDSFESDSLARLIDAIGQLDFIQGERSQSVAVRNRESMGREVMSEVKAIKGEIPEEVLLSVRIFRDPVLLRRHSIRCLLETDPSNGRLALVPLAGQIDEALDKEMSSLGDMLRSSVGAARRLTGPALETDDVAADPEWQIPVFYGQP